MEVVWSNQPKAVYFLKDHLGSVRATVDKTVAVVGYDDYDPWGYALSQRTQPTPWSVTEGVAEKKFTGKEWEDDYSLNWVWVDRRPYMPEIGPWAVMEPLEQMSPGLSPYAYSFNNPILFLDPNGAFPYTFHIRAFAPPTSFRRFGYHVGGAPKSGH